MGLIMLPAVKRVAAAPALAATLALLGAGCGGPEARDSASIERIAETIDELEQALGEGDLDRVCEQILSPEARRRAGGEECPRRLARTTVAVERPRIELMSVTLGSTGALARVRAWTDDEPPALDSMRLVATPGGYRIESLSGG